MAKQPNWTKEEKAKLTEMMEAHAPWEEIATALGRSVVGVKIMRARLGFEPLCVDCNVRILRPLATRTWKPAERCADCIKQRKKYYYKNYFEKHGRAKLVIKRNALRFDGKREKVIQRDGEQCVKCAMTRKQHKEKFGCDITVDHIKGGDRDVKKLDNDMSNLQTLCLPCHGKKDWQRRRKDWSMCGTVLKKYWEERRKTGGFQFRCRCGNMMRIQYDPIKNYRRLQKERCGKC